jgi:phage terminase small subunit
MSSKLTHSQIQFIEHFVELGDATKAYKLAGYAGGDRSNAHKLVTRLSAEINQRLQSRMAMSTSVALNVLESIMTNEDNAPRDRLNAVSSWLDRAGVARASTQQIDLKTTDIVPENRKVIRENQQMIMVGNGMLLPPLGENDATAFDTNDAETFEYLKQKQH